MDWFRQAQDRKRWSRKVKKSLPKIELSKDYKRALNRWRPGAPLPRRAVDNSEEADDPGGAAESEVDESGGEVDGSFPCPCCDRVFDAGNALYFHYTEMHAVHDPELATLVSYQCEHCFVFFGRALKYHYPTCPARLELRREIEVQGGRWLPVAHGPHQAPPAGWWVATDGSCVDGAAGWGVAVFRTDSSGRTSETPSFILHGPVCTKAWDGRWIGAREHTHE